MCSLKRSVCPMCSTLKQKLTTNHSFLHLRKSFGEEVTERKSWDGKEESLLNYSLMSMISANLKCNFLTLN